MPAAPSSLTGPAIGQLLTAVQAVGGDRARLLPVLATVPDPRARRGVRHPLAAILGLAVCAVLAGARSFTAIAEGAADADQGTRDALQLQPAGLCPRAQLRAPAQQPVQLLKARTGHAVDRHAVRQSVPGSRGSSAATW